MNVLVDTGVWYAFCDTRERPRDRQSIESLLESLEFAQILLPWPVAYETVRTKLCRNGPALATLERLMSKRNVIFLDDTSYREDALQLAFEMSVRKKPTRPLSMVDCLLRLMLDDRNLKIQRFATFNENDFRDVCGNRMIEMVR